MDLRVMYLISYGDTAHAIATLAYPECRNRRISVSVANMVKGDILGQDPTTCCRYGEMPTIT